MLKGIYQGCVLTVLLFSLYRNDLKELLNELIYAPYVYNFYAYYASYHSFLDLISFFFFSVVLSALPTDC